ncbi:MAG: glycine--tRNA ligase [Candidatus Dependentiae bacterium]|nr:glycine--tRNA ligase [Candidatus Dependentiae bacterium]
MSSTTNTVVTLDKIVALCKRKGFVYQSAEIYGGLNGVYDFGHLGHLLKENIRKSWTNAMNRTEKGDILSLEGSLLGPESVWAASGHIENFHDPMVDCLKCKHRYRADELDLNKPCPHCGNKAWTEIREFNMMFKTNLGANAEQATVAYLRPETAQAIYINFKNVLSTNRVKIPFGITQIGKAFRNEITPKQFLFRMREFEQMEMEWFCKPETAEQDFEFWCKERMSFYKTIGINTSKLRFHVHDKDSLAHYSKGCKDIEYEFPFGWKELEGIAYRGDYDLTQHSKHSGKDLGVHDEQTKSSYIPHIVESSVGVDRLFLTILFDSYTEDIVEGEPRVVLKFHPTIAPIKAAFLPLIKKISEPMEKIYRDIKRKGYMVDFDESGSIGKRYRRQDEMGTPLCFTYDFESETDHCVTVRDRDTTKQERIAIDQIVNYLESTLKKA